MKDKANKTQTKEVSQDTKFKGSRKDSYKEKKTDKDYKSKDNHNKKHNYKEFSSCNDVQWYSTNESMFNTSASIQYSQISGLPFQLTFGGPDTDIQSETSTMPGIMVLKYIPGVGVSFDKNSNINVAARLVYTFIRHANSGSRNYESPDLMTYMLAIANAQAYYAYMCRIYGLINHHSVMNRYITKALVEAGGGDYEDLVRNMAAFNYYINFYANKLNSFAVPKDQYYYDRAAFLPLHVFTDGENEKAQMYLFKPEGFYRWTGTKYETGSALEFKFINDTMTLEQIIEFGNELLNALLSNEDIGIMSGDVLKAFGSEKIRQLVMINSEYVTQIIRDEGILAQIHNSNSFAAGYILDNASLDITQEDGELKYGIRLYQRKFNKNLLLDAWSDNPSPAYTMEATRLQTICSDTVGEGVNSAVVSSGTEVITKYVIYYFTESGHLTTSSVYTNSIISQDLSLLGLELLTKFDWHPIVYVGSMSGSAVTSINVVGDLQNYTIVDREMLDRLHNCAIQSLFNVFGLYLKTK